MFIKTVSTTSGINPIKFDETGGVFYWILNTGSSTIYASTKAIFTAGDDGVVSLGPKESRRLETNTDTIYILGEGQVEIHNQRDGICSFKQAPTSSGGGGDIDAYTKTESDAKYAQKTDIPSSLPANGGNADTLDGHPADYFAKYDNPSIEGTISLVRSGNATTAGTVFAWEDTLRLRNQDPNAENTTYTDLLLTPSGIFTEGISNGNYISRKEISATPIKSTTFSSTADGTGNFNLWVSSENKVPISIQLDNKTFYAVPFLYNNQVWLGSTINEVTRQPVTDTTVSGTVYYIEV